MNIKYRENTIPLITHIPLNDKKPIKKAISIGFWIFILLAILVTVILIAVNDGNSNFLNMSIVLVALIIFVIIFILLFIYQIYYLKSYYYDMSQDTLTIRKGVIGKNQIYLQVLFHFQLTRG